jgi:hypothetical protein
VLTFYGRVPRDRLAIDGDRTVVEELLTWVKTE